MNEPPNHSPTEARDAPPASLKLDGRHNHVDSRPKFLHVPINLHQPNKNLEALMSSRSRNFRSIFLPAALGAAFVCGIPLVRAGVDIDGTMKNSAGAGLNPVWQACSGWVPISMPIMMPRSAGPPQTAKATQFPCSWTAALMCTRGPTFRSAGQPPTDILKGSRYC
jgi:hypothetical protein